MTATEKHQFQDSCCVAASPGGFKSLLQHASVMFGGSERPLQLRHSLLHLVDGSSRVTEDNAQ